MSASRIHEARGPRTTREIKRLEAGLPPTVSALWYGPSMGYGTKPTKAQAAIIAAAKKALS